MAQEKDLNLTIDKEVKELVIRHDEPQIIHELEPINISGTIATPLQFIQKRKDTFDHIDARVKVDPVNVKIELTFNEDNFLKSTVAGQLQIEPKIGVFGINSGKYRSPEELAELIKMNRTCFENQSVAMGLVTTLKAFKAKVNTEIEKISSNLGNRRQLVDRVVNSNLPETFYMFMPLFKGEAKHRFEVEIYFNPDDITCTLISPQCNDIIEETKEEIMGNIIAGIQEIAPEILIYTV
jgi:hypothetical protein